VLLEVFLYLVLFLPLVSAVYTIAFRSILSGRVLAIHASILMLLSAVLSWVAGVAFYRSVDKKIYIHLCQWLDIENLSVSFGIYFDILTAIMMVMITTISVVVHIYSIGYMKKDEGIAKFMSYIGIFTFFMLFLVFSSNLVQLFFGWEGVGLSSYLLIGYWYQKEVANKAAMKAFIMNRIGDLGLILGIVMSFYLFKSVDYVGILDSLSFVSGSKIEIVGMSISIFTAVNLLFFFGAMGKSAQFGLHTWLPDAMEGPTPASALIHAATMVTAGVFLVVRLSPLYALSSFSLEVVAVVGLITSIFAGTVAVVQTDLKKTIAYSTCSQLGMMFFAVGVQAYTIAIFHLVVHACFKALLFLGAGAIIQSTSGEKNMLKMGGLYKYLPKTYMLMWIGSLALMGVPFFSGYYSKDAIMEVVWSYGGFLGSSIYYGGLFAICLTAFYTVRIMLLVFHGSTNLSSSVIQEPSKLLLIPMYFLAFLVIIMGPILEPLFTHNIHILWQKVVSVEVELKLLKIAKHVPYIYIFLPLFMVCLGVFGGYILLRKGKLNFIVFKKRYQDIYEFLYKQWYIDILYSRVISHLYRRLSFVLWKKIDKGAIDQLGLHGIVTVLVDIGRKSIRLQTGDICHYILAAVVGIGCIIWLNLI